MRARRTRNNFSHNLPGRGPSETRYKLPILCNRSIQTPDGIDPAGAVVVDGVQATVSISAGVDGLRVLSNKPGDVLIEDAGDDDVIDGTVGADRLFVGDGNDTIRAGAGADVVYGGRGGDTIDLGADNDVDRLAYGAAEFDDGQPRFEDGDMTAHIDKIDHLGIGHIVDLGRPFGGAPVLPDTYLSGLDDNEYALVRGSANGGRFVRGDSAADDDFMLQWSTNGVVGSTILRDIGSRANVIIDRAAGTLTLAAPAPAMSLVSSISYSSLLGDVITATFESLPDPVTHTPGSATGLANRNGFVLLNYREFSPLPTAPGHVAAPGFGLRDNVLSLNGPLASNLYSLFWTNDTFDTTADYLATGQVFFAGGHNNGFDNDGFAVVAMRTMSGNTTFTDAVPWAIFGNASGTASLVTGSGNDVVLSKAGALTVVYASITPPCSTTARRMTMASSTPTRSPSSPPSTAARRPRAISSWWGCRRRDGADTLRCPKRRYCHWQ